MVPRGGCTGREILQLPSCRARKSELEAFLIIHSRSNSNINVLSGTKPAMPAQAAQISWMFAVGEQSSVCACVYVFSVGKRPGWHNHARGKKKFFGVHFCEHAVGALQGFELRPMRVLCFLGSSCCWHSMHVLLPILCMCERAYARPHMHSRGRLFWSRVCEQKQKRKGPLQEREG